MNWKDPALRRLVGRAVVSGLFAGLASWQASDGTSGAIVGVIVAAAMAAVQVFTPLASVGPVKIKPEDYPVPPAPEAAKK